MDSCSPTLEPSDIVASDKMANVAIAAFKSVDIYKIVYRCDIQYFDTVEEEKSMHFLHHIRCHENNLNIKSSKSIIGKMKIYVFCESIINSDNILNFYSLKRISFL